MRGTPREQQKLMDSKGFTTLGLCAAVLRVAYITCYRYYHGRIKGTKLEGMRIGRAIYIRKTSLAAALKRSDPDNALMIAWCLGLEPTGECETCSIPMPLHLMRCPLCHCIDLREEPSA